MLNQNSKVLSIKQVAVYPGMTLENYSNTIKRPSLPESAFTGLKRGIIYARVSTDEQAESGTSIDNQVEKSLAYAIAHNIHIPPEFIFREDYTGKDLDRPELNKVRSILQARQADCLIVYKTNRLDRSEWGINLLILLQELKLLGIELHYSQSGRQVDLSNPVEALMQSIEGWQAGEDHRETVTKLAEGRYNRAKEGSTLVFGMPPYGYRLLEPEEKGGKYFLVIDEVEAEVIRLIFQWYVYGDETKQRLGLTRIAQKLSERGYPTWEDRKARGNKKRGPGQWSRSSIQKIISNETYAGVWYFGKGTADPTTKKRIPHPRDYWVPVEVPAIINRDLWEVAQELKEKNKHLGNRRIYQYLLTGHMKCGCCGYKMSGARPKVGIMYYRCPCRASQSLVFKDCTLPYFRVDKVDPKIWNWLEEIIRDKKKLRDGMEAYQEFMATEATPLQRDLDLVELQITESEEELNELMTDYKEAIGRRHKANLAVDIERVEGQLDELEKRRDELLRKLKETTLMDEQIEEFEQFAEMIRDDIDEIAKDFDSRRMLLDWLNIQVTFLVKDGKKYASVTGKITPKAVMLCLESNSTRRSSRKLPPGRPLAR